MNNFVALLVRFVQHGKGERERRIVRFHNETEIVFCVKFELVSTVVSDLTERSPNITELHNQLLDVRKDLARQKYVNQVLWRKLDALMDIHGSNTRAELMIELANFHDEVELLKAKNQRTNDARSAILNPCSRSSSGFICFALGLIED